MKWEIGHDEEEVDGVYRWQYWHVDFAVGMVDVVVTVGASLGGVKGQCGQVFFVTLL